MSIPIDTVRGVADRVAGDPAVQELFPGVNGDVLLLAGAVVLLCVLYWRRQIVSVLGRLNLVRRHRLKRRIAAATKQVEEDMETGAVPYDPEKLQGHIKQAREYVDTWRYREAHRELNKIENVLR